MPEVVSASRTRDARREEIALRERNEREEAFKSSAITYVPRPPPSLSRSHDIKKTCSSGDRGSDQIKISGVALL